PETLASLAAAELPLADLAPPALDRAATEELSEPGRFDDTDTAAMANQRSDEAEQQFNDASAVEDLSPVSLAKQERRERARLKSLDNLALFAELHESDQTAAEAAAELQARGLSIRQIEVGMHLCSPDAHERRTWTEYLPGIRGVSAKAWLLHLSRDESVGVRRAAMNLLATSGDPEMLRRVGELAREDNDPELRLEAARAVDLLDEPAP
ncbi:MAG TPA: HEAT repeat domain-containing protein, partial [Pirellulales bacterium]|nr:HEAT repeat domain-containing protein [Pirellulales bacterium]